MRKKALLVNTATMKQPLLSILSFGVDNRTRSKTIEDYYEYYVLHQHGGGDGDDGDDYDEHCSEELRGRRRRGKGKICSRDEQYRADRCMALKLQRRLVEEEREEERLARRKDRRMWYEYFLKPYSVVSTIVLESIVLSLSLSLFPHPQCLTVHTFDFSFPL